MTGLPAVILCVDYTLSMSWGCQAGGVQAGTKTGRGNINNLRRVDDTAPMAESEGELKSLAEGEGGG